MNISSLPYALDITSTTGDTLSSEEIHVMVNSLLLLQHENHFTKIHFWGKIFGIENDYYVAFGYSENSKRGRVFYYRVYSNPYGNDHFYANIRDGYEISADIKDLNVSIYSINHRDWALLNGPTLRALKLFLKANERFQGDPSYLLDCKQAISSDNNSVGTGAEHHLKEEDRLAVLVTAICDDCAIAPKGAFTQCDYLEANPAFQGLSLDEGRDLQSWMHIRNGGGGGDWAGSGDSRQGLRGKWSVRVRGQGSVCVLRSLSWLGFTAYHRLRTPDHGFVYFGDGIKAVNIHSPAEQDDCKEVTAHT